MNRVKISVIIPVYNAEIFLTRAIDSVLASSMRELEILVIDDASPGNCQEIVAGYKEDPRVRYIRHEKNLGLFAARCTGITHAKGEYLVHLDPDDWIIDDIYRNAYSLATRKSLDFVLFNVIQEDENAYRWIEDENVLKECHKGKDVIDHIFGSKSKAWIWHVSWNKLMKSDKVREVLHYFRQSDHLNMYEDLLWSVAIFSHHYNSDKVGILEQVGLVYYRHSASITKSVGYASYAKKYNDLNFVLKKIEKILNDYKIFSKYQKDFYKLSCYVLEMHSPLKQKVSGFFNTLKLMFLQGQYKRGWQNVCEDYNDISESAEILQKKVEHLGLDEVAIFGTGEFAIKLKKAFDENNVATRFFISSDTLFVGKKIDGVDVVDIEEAITKCQNKYICIASIGSFEKIAQMLKERGNGENITYITIKSGE
ncbi:glycosyltransferase family 2 protein [bacterium]|nr:glycosyltransferase family 2 protein [bacterium]MBU1884207.1 glycosyltransferase family 2 protein [bacterium]